jgi:uncharacterized membrane protein YGL010W
VFGRRPIETWVSEYERSHQHPVNRLCHALAIPLIVLSVGLGGLSVLVHRLWPWAAAGFAIGWTLQLVGHAFEGRPPEFLKDWRFLLVGLRWWWTTMRRRPDP